MMEIKVQDREGNEVTIFNRKGDAKKGLDFIEHEMPKEQLYEKLASARREGDRDVNFPLYINGRTLNYILKHVGYDEYELIANG